MNSRDTVYDVSYIIELDGGDLGSGNERIPVPNHLENKEDYFKKIIALRHERKK